MFKGDHEEAFAYIAEAGGKYAIYNIWGEYDTVEEVSRKADYLNSLAPLAEQAGINLLYHNHSKEFHNLLNTLVNGNEREYIKELKTYHIPTTIE
jgi:sugar phosphate isomerase/epimerase